MKLMVIDTSLGTCLAGSFNVEGDSVTTLGLRVEEMTKGHQEHLGGFARDASHEAGGFDGMQRIGVTVGPGSFTGLRVGLSFALGLGAALQCEVVGLSTLDALAASVPETGLVVAAIDARRGQVYMRLFRDGAPLGEPEAVALEDAATRILEAGDVAECVIVGSGGPVLVETNPALSAARFVPLVAALPEALARLTARSTPDENPAKPVYLRAPDATPPTRLPGQPRS